MNLARVKQLNVGDIVGIMGIIGDMKETAG
jgi:hypothetical protein